MRRCAALLIALTVGLPGSVLAQGASPGQAPAPAPTAQKTDSGWWAIVYPVYAWLPIHRAETRLPEVPEDGGTVRPEADTDSELDSAFLGAFRVEKNWFALEGGYTYAGLSGEAESPRVKLEVDASIADLRAGFEMAQDFYLEGGVRWIGLDTKTTIGDYAAVDWEPSLVEPVIGLTYRPLLSERWRLILHGDIGGLGTGDSSTATGSVRVEWQPMKHLTLLLGYTAMYLKTEGTIGRRDIELDQTLYGPIVGFGIPF